MDISIYLKKMVQAQASDLYLLTDALPSVKIDGEVEAIGDEPLPPSYVKGLAYDMMNERQIEIYERDWELSLAIADPDFGRFRVNIYHESNETAMVLRHIKDEIPSMEALHLPPVLAELVMKKSGLILFVGATGVGKSTSMASMIDYRNTHASGHIVTIEDPIEYLHSHKQSIITQREVGIDTKSYGLALKNTLRQSPDVILIGEIRDDETMMHAMAYSQTGHLCLSTLHANNAAQAIERILHFFPEERRAQLRLELSFNLRAIVSQRLLPAVKGGVVPVFEILLATPLVKDLLQRDELASIPEVMSQSEDRGMRTFDMSLLELVNKGKISNEVALSFADSSNNLRIAIAKGNPNIEPNHNLSLLDKDSLTHDEDSDLYP